MSLDEIMFGILDLGLNYGNILILAVVQAFCVLEWLGHSTFFLKQGSNKVFLEKEAYPRSLHMKDACGYIIKNEVRNKQDLISITARKRIENKNEHSKPQPARTKE